MKTTRERFASLLNDEKYRYQYKKRVQMYSEVAKYVPTNYEEIASDRTPWFCHGLAFRMATYTESGEVIFQRLNYLLLMAKELDGWNNESKNIANWSENYDGFFHILWMLQCVEYFIDRGDEVQFSGKKGRASPDLKIIAKSGDELYVECYVYSKWWFFEELITYLLEMSDPNLCLERIHNIKVNNLNKSFEYLLVEVWGIIEEEKLEKAREEASKKSPYVMFRKNGIQIIMEGEGEMEANPNNAQGDPGYSADLYIDEIVRHKEHANALYEKQNNCLMVNGLGIDYQHIFFSKRVEKLTFTSSKINTLKIYACGIDEKLEGCQYQLNVHQI
jgi:hypothetical protein